MREISYEELDEIECPLNPTHVVPTIIRKYDKNFGYRYYVEESIK